MRLVVAIAALIASPAFADPNELECMTIRSHIEAIEEQAAARLVEGAIASDKVRAAINAVIVDQRMPADLGDEARQSIFGSAFSEWEASYDNGQFRAPESPAFDALMRDKCGD